MQGTTSSAGILILYYKIIMRTLMMWVRALEDALAEDAPLRGRPSEVVVCATVRFYASFAKIILPRLFSMKCTF